MTYTDILIRKLRRAVELHDHVSEVYLRQALRRIEFGRRDWTTRRPAAHL